MHEQGQRDAWGKLEIIGKGILVPIVVAIIGLLIRNRLAVLEEHSHIASRDFTIMTEFQKIYADQGSRRLAPYYVNRIQDPELRDQLRKFMIWDILEKNVQSAAQLPPFAKAHQGEAPAFHFEPELQDWHMLGDIAFQMRSDPASSAAFSQWWHRDLQEHAVQSRWSRNAAELRKLFGWVARVYWSEAVETPQPSSLLSKSAAADTVASTAGTRAGSVPATSK